ncbi:hypothetical protein GJ496_001870 [Pomphorhynchus laevis]|nr:hypothetical protein GJ496_001870 [Pomphorhynchus laevis]
MKKLYRHILKSDTRSDTVDSIFHSANGTRNITEMKAEQVLENIQANILATDTNIMDNHQLIILGASGDLASKKIYPSIWQLYKQSLLPSKVTFIGYARSDINVSKIRKNIERYCKVNGDEETKLFNEYMQKNYYVRGSYDKPEDFKKLHKFLNEHQETDICHRIFYLALPPLVYEDVCTLISSYCRPAHSNKSWIRVIIEKPFGKDLSSSDKLEAGIKKHLDEKEIYRIDHYLGKEMVQSLIMLRFANQIFSKTWNRDSIKCVLITFKENIGTLGRGGYFDQYGIIRDVMQNHLLQIMCVVAMEPPVSLAADDIRNEKVKVLRSVRNVEYENVLVGQYVGNPNGTNVDQRTSYVDDESVKNNNTRTPTFACTVLYIDNERWSGVPFILKCGKALNERKTEIRVQFKASVNNDLFRRNTDSNIALHEKSRDELVIRVQPDEAIYLKIINKKPGWDFKAEQTELDLTYHERYNDHNLLPDAYERLILDVFVGTQANFVRSDELHEAWKIFTPVLNHIEKNVSPDSYTFGDRTLKGADDLCKKVGFVYSSQYEWPGKRSNLILK